MGDPVGVYVGDGAIIGAPDGAADGLSVVGAFVVGIGVGERDGAVLGDDVVVVVVVVVGDADGDGLGDVVTGDGEGGAVGCGAAVDIKSIIYCPLTF